MNYSNHALNVLAARTFKGIGDAWINNNITSDSCYEQIIELIIKKNIDGFSEVAFNAMKDRLQILIEGLGSSCDGVVAVGDSNFPNLRRELKAGERPSFLFYKGDLQLLDPNNYNVAVIGLLNPDEDTIEDENKVVEYFVKNEYATIVSGLAQGCDAVAHKKALDCNGTTVAILPSPLNNILPAQNRALAQEIVENNGLLITEYLTSTSDYRDLAGRYVKRDRLQALFSDLVVLSASYSKSSFDPNNSKPDSGARHAMEKAKMYSIERAVIYNSKYDRSIKYDLNRQIISEDKSQANCINPQDLKCSIKNIIDKTQKKSDLSKQNQLL